MLIKLQEGLEELANMEFLNEQPIVDKKKMSSRFVRMLLCCLVSSFLAQEKLYDCVFV